MQMLAILKRATNPKYKKSDTDQGKANQFVQNDT
jgi:hypothetical protein